MNEVCHVFSSFITVNKKKQQQETIKKFFNLYADYWLFMQKKMI